MLTHDASDLRDTMLPCACGQRVVLVNVMRHYDRDGDITFWTGECNNCGTAHTIFND
jgi:hypothetical protein